MEDKLTTPRPPPCLAYLPLPSLPLPLSPFSSPSLPFYSLSLSDPIFPNFSAFLFLLFLILYPFFSLYSSSSASLFCLSYLTSFFSYLTPSLPSLLYKSSFPFFLPCVSYSSLSLYLLLPLPPFPLLSISPSSFYQLFLLSLVLCNLPFLSSFSTISKLPPTSLPPSCPPLPHPCIPLPAPDRAHTKARGIKILFSRERLIKFHANSKHMRKQI